MSKRKKKKRRIKLTIKPMDLLRAIRKPTARGIVVLKDKRRYTRKQKHKKNFGRDE